MSQDFDRTRSFVERYVLERAAHFRLGFEKEDAWIAILDGKTIYDGIGRMATDPDANKITGVGGMNQQSGAATQGPAPQAMGSLGGKVPSNMPSPQAMAAMLVRNKPPYAAPAIEASPDPGASSGWMGKLLAKVMS